MLESRKVVFRSAKERPSASERRQISEYLIMIMESDDQPHERATFSRNPFAKRQLRRRKSRALIKT